MKEYFVYILANFSNSVLYVGTTNNLERRVWEHKHTASLDTFTGKYKVYKLVWFAIFPTADEAILVEKRIKGWVRVKKINLIKKNNPQWKDLSLR